MKSGHVSNFQQLSKFNTLKDFNTSMEQWYLDIHQQKLLTKSELIALKRLVRFSASVFGVCNAKIGTIVAATHNGNFGISRSTFKRMLLKVQEINLITIHHTFNNGKQGHSVYVFNCYQSTKESNSDPLQDSIEPLQQEQIEPAETINLSKANKHNIDIRKDNVIKGIPIEFSSLVMTYGYTPRETIEFWKCVRNLTQHYNEFIEDYVDYYAGLDKCWLGIRTFKQCIVNMKLGYNIRNIYGYFYKICEQILNAEWKMLIA
ncbi:hypothetical protein ACQCPP_12600 [Priestia megaterium]|uniref:hypothetical protein n=1 Tax=Priestia megaterium TaxID=1404 RepID=UPI003CFE0D31